MNWGANRANIKVYYLLKDEDHKVDHIKKHGHE